LEQVPIGRLVGLLRGADLSLNCGVPGWLPANIAELCAMSI
jgi:hypothetical protein